RPLAQGVLVIENILYRRAERTRSGMTNPGIKSLLTQFRELSSDERAKGRMFERLIANYLVKDPQYGDLLQDVWLWEEWPDRWGADVGIDLVARERGTGD